MATSRNQRRAFANVVMKLRIPQKGEFLEHRSPSGEILLAGDAYWSMQIFQKSFNSTAYEECRLFG
jgi:hypothetical protein